MKKRLTITVFITMFLLGLVACGSNDTDTKKEKIVQEEAQASPTVEDSLEESEANAEINEEDFVEAENEGTEIVEKKSDLPIWYMDSEGMKNDELGIMIRKDSDVLSRLGCTVSFFIVSPMDTGGTISKGCFITCDYYEGDADAYLSSYYEKEEGRVGDIECIYYGLEGYAKDNVLFIGNGVAISFALDPEGKDIGDYLNEIELIKVDDGPSVDCLAYLAEDGLHCPALGMKITYEEGRIEEGPEGCSVNVWFPGDLLQLKKWKGVDGLNVENAQKRVDEYVETKIESSDELVEYTSDEEITEVNIGNCQYFGRSVISQYEGESEKNREWLFCADESSWSISLSHSEDDKYEDYINVLEKLK